MADLVVCVPRQRWRDWLREGSLPGDQSTDRFGFYVKTDERPPVEPGDRIYVIAWDRLRGYAPLLELQEAREGFTLIRAGNAVACTLPSPTKSFPGWKLRWWQCGDEVPFADWQTAGVDDAPKPTAPRGSVTKLAYAPVVQPRPDKLLSTEEFDRQFVAALAEIDVHGALSWETPTMRYLYVIRCGERVSKATKCMRPRHHDGDCSPKWSSS